MCNRASRPVITGTSAVRGFTLVEVLAAVALLSIGLLAVLAAGRAARETQTRAVYLSIGRNVAQTKIEQLRTVPFSMAGYAAQTTDPSLPDGNTVVVRCWPFSGAFGSSMTQVVVTVRWPEQRGTRTIVYETLIKPK